jgi:hypothetical protein
MSFCTFNLSHVPRLVVFRTLNTVHKEYVFRIKKGLMWSFLKVISLFHSENVLFTYGVFAYQIMPFAI